MESCLPCVGIISIVVGILVQVFATDPRFADKSKRENTSNMSFYSELKEVLLEAKSVIRIPSFQIIVAQGVAGTFPWSGLSSFAPMWLELISFSHETTAVLITMYVIGNSDGGLCGGKMGDILSKTIPNTGRIILSQISSGSAIPLAAILFLGLPDDTSGSYKYGLVLLIMEIATSWNAPATNKYVLTSHFSLIKASFSSHDFY